MIAPELDAVLETVAWQTSFGVGGLFHVFPVLVVSLVLLQMRWFVKCTLSAAAGSTTGVTARASVSMVIFKCSKEAAYSTCLPVDLTMVFLPEVWEELNKLVTICSSSQGKMKACNEGMGFIFKTGFSSRITICLFELNCVCFHAPAVVLFLSLAVWDRPLDIAASPVVSDLLLSVSSGSQFITQHCSSSSGSLVICSTSLFISLGRLFIRLVSLGRLFDWLVFLGGLFGLGHWMGGWAPSASIVKVALPSLSQAATVFLLHLLCQRSSRGHCRLLRGDLEEGPLLHPQDAGDIVPHKGSLFSGFVCSPTPW